MSRIHNISGTAALLAALALTITSTTPAQEVYNGLAAVVNGNPVTQSEVRELVRAQEFLLRRKYPAGGDSYDKEVAKLRDSALDDLIDRELILSDFQSKGLAMKDQHVNITLDQEILERTKGDRGEFLKQLAEAGISLKKYKKILRDRLIVSAMRANETRDVAPPTPAERDAFFKKNSDLFREKSFVKLSTITIAKRMQDPSITEASQRKLIEEIRRRILKGANFASEAKTYSQDSTSEQGGDRGWIDADKSPLNGTVTNAAFALKSGQVSGIIEDRNAFYLLKADQVNKGKLKPRAEIEDELNQRVIQMKRREANDAWMEKLRSDSRIKRY